MSSTSFVHNILDDVTEPSELTLTLSSLLLAALLAFAVSWFVAPKFGQNFPT
jgi:hypothetical protein